jgi:predicted DNA binding CopG/RHH family protein
MKKKLATKQKGGRPPLPDGQRRDKRLDDVRFSAGELSRAKAMAAAAGLPWSLWVRRRLGVSEV